MFKFMKSTPITLKIKLVNDIRRITFQDKPSYDELTKTLQELYSSVDLKQYILKYKDDEGDLVTISSQLDLNEAFSFISEVESSHNILRLEFIPNPQPQIVHFHVICDGCEQAPLIGIRWKCTTCPDYDLCSNCKDKGIHNETGHTYNRIDKPHQFWARRFCRNTQLSAEFISDVTIEDGMVIPPNSPFKKTWRVKNSGRQPWSPDTELVFWRGTSMCSVKKVNVPLVRPGETVDISLDMISPKEHGKYLAYYVLRAPNMRFHRFSLWVEIVVPQQEPKPEPKLESIPQPKPESKPQPKPEPKPQPESQSLNLQDEFYFQIQTLSEMGFRNIENIRSLLVTFEGDIVRVVQHLLR
jgi:hypothetical protein